MVEQKDVAVEATKLGKEMLKYLLKELVKNEGVLELEMKALAVDNAGALALIEGVQPILQQAVDKLIEKI